MRTALFLQAKLYHIGGTLLALGSFRHYSRRPVWARR